MTIRLPFPLSLYQAWGRQRGTGYLFKKKEYLDYMSESFLLLSQQKFYLASDKVWSVEIFLHSDNWLTKKGKLNKRGGDLDNFQKVLFDTLVKYGEQEKFGFDDSQIVEILIKKVYDKNQKCAVLRFTESSLA